MRRKLFIIVILPIGIALVLGELYVRIFSAAGYITPETLRSKSLQYVPTVFARHLFPEREIIAPGIDEGDVWKINAQGYRGANFSIDKSPSVVRIIIYGGSSVFDLAATDGEDWPHLVEKKLKSTGLPVEIINAGIPAHATFDAVGRLFTEGHILKPDYVLLYDEWNDLKNFHSDQPLIRQLTPYHESNNPILVYHGFLDKWLSELSQLYVRVRNKYLASRLHLSLEGQISPGPFSDTISSQARNQYELDLKTFIDVARNSGAIPVLLTEARLIAAGNTEDEMKKINYDLVKFRHEGLVHAFSVADDAIASVAAEKKVTVIDASTHISGTDEYFRDHIHTTELGSQKVAEIVAEQLKKIMEEKLQ